MWIDLSKAVLFVATSVGAYFDPTIWWVPLCVLSTMFAVAMKVPPWQTAKDRAKMEAYRQQYLNEVMGRGNDTPMDKDKLN